MQSFAALVLSAALAISAPMSQEILRASSDGPDAGEVYVAELDADWNVAREIRQPCALERGCTVDLGLTHAGLGRVRVRFDVARSGKITVNSVLEDRSGKAAAQAAMTLALDPTGFGVGHFTAKPLSTAAGDGTGAADLGSADGQPIILLAVRVPGWVAPVSPPVGDRI